VRARERAKVRAVVTDLDGTLTDHRRRVDPEAIAAVRWLEDHGTPVVLATGNVLPIALALHRFLALSGPIVAENGGLLYTRPDGVDRIDRLSDRRIAERALRRLHAEGIRARPLFTDRWRETEVAIEETVSLARVRRALEGFPVTAESTGFAIHLIEEGVGKRSTVELALRRLGIDLAECAALGDGDNDVSLLEAAGWSASFADASAAARRAADYVSRRPGAQGFVEGLIHRGLVPRRKSRAGRIDARR
jgi:phosphoglycolate phosphatase